MLSCIIDKSLAAKSYAVFLHRYLKHRDSVGIEGVKTENVECHVFYRAHKGGGVHKAIRYLARFIKAAIFRKDLVLEACEDYSVPRVIFFNKAKSLFDS